MNWTPAVVDSNIFVYAYDPTDPVKRVKALAFLKKQGADGILSISTQVLHEFYNRVTKPNKPPALSHVEAVNVIEEIVNSAIVHSLSLPATKYALYAI